MFHLTWSRGLVPTCIKCMLTTCKIEQWVLAIRDTFFAVIGCFIYMYIWLFEQNIPPPPAITCILILCK